MRFSVIFLVGTGLFGCGGQLVLWESELAPDSDTTIERCNLFTPEGTCPGADLCCSGVCDTDCAEWTCECLPEQACRSGTCLDIDEQNKCSLSQLDGLCPMGEVCVAGQCVPIDEENVCSTEHPEGLCPAGASCVGGICLPTDDLPCSPDEPDGRCPAGQVCLPPGECVVVPCSSSAPQGACDRPGEYCNQGVCECIPCQTGHLDGCCEDGFFCSVTAQCLADGDCGAPEDCPSPETFCSVLGQCINNGTCLDDGDCESPYVCDLNDSLCVRGYDCSAHGDADCLPEEYCSLSKHCLPDGICEQDGDCRDAGLICSVIEECIPKGTCRDNGDCDAPLFCASDDQCRNPGECADTVDCPPGHYCDPPTCRPDTLCDTNGPASCISVGGDELWCCDATEDCCPQGQRCSISAGVCLLDGQCLTAADCPGGSTYFSCVDYTCQPVQPCVDLCPGTLNCSTEGGCLPSEVQCGGDGDCEAGEVCNALFECEPETGCGNQEFEASLVPPNVLILFDRSGSMNYCDDDLITRWYEALGVLQTVLDENAQTMRFGLSVFPQQCTGTTACAYTCDHPFYHRNTEYACLAPYDGSVFPHHDDYVNNCNGTYCDASGQTVSWGAPGYLTNIRPGVVEVAVGSGTSPTILSTLANTYPGGGTPIGPTLRNVIADPAAFGLTDTDRPNVIVLVTDGEANADGADDIPAVGGGTCSNDSSDAASVCKVNSALATLRGLSPSISTYVVGFTISDQPIINHLKCFAVNGGTSQCDETITFANCESDTTANCHYQADDATALANQLALIAEQVASCNFSLGQVPQDSNRLNVYLNYQCGDIDEPTACTQTPSCAWQNNVCLGDPMRLERDPSRIDNWDYEPSTNQIQFFGSACQTIRAEPVKPVVIMGCCTGESC